MSYPDWVYDRGLEDEEWVHDRWGDDDDYYDYDDNADESLNPSEVERKEIKMEKRVLFSEKHIPEHPHELKSFSKNVYGANKNIDFFETLLTQTELLAYQKKNINISDEYGRISEKIADVIIVRPEIKELGKVFGVSIDDIACENFSDVANKIRMQEDKFLILLDKIKEWFLAYESLDSNNIDFIDLYSDKVSLNRMIKGLRSYYHINHRFAYQDFKNKNLYCYDIKDEYGRIFLPLQSICRNFAFDLDTEKRKSDLQEIIAKRDTAASTKSYYNYEQKEVEKQYALIQSFEQTNCFARETFAMLYLRLEPYVQKETAILNFLQKNYFIKVTE